ncbi:putative ABC transporter ATP-binding protein [Lachnospiraceae bacterium]|jgi:ABC-type lipoprotein export system ATPase subunit|nr:putative ABC transporter ATP-binding protein [Lachnospiraceae bacterium]
MNKLRIENISYRYSNHYQTTYALREVSAQFQSGQFCVIEGKSGSGKTTMLSLLAGLDLPSEGTIYLNEKSYRELNRDDLRRRQLSIIFQNYNLFPLLTVQENIAYPLGLTGRKKGNWKERINEILESVGLNETMLKKYPGMLSGGEQQRVAIARTIASEAPIILADEPTGNLDTANSGRIVENLKKLSHEDGRCVILVTHDPDIARQADVLYRMSDGRIAEKQNRIGDG